MNKILAFLIILFLVTEAKAKSWPFQVADRIVRGEVVDEKMKPYPEFLSD